MVPRPLPSLKWQVTQAFSVKSFSPACERISALLSSPTAMRRIAGSITVTQPPITRVIGAAILRTVKAVPARLGGPEPHGVVVARHHVHLHAERRDEKSWITSSLAMISRTLRPYRNMQFVNFFQPIGLLHFPHPLFADDVDIQCVVRRVPVIDINHPRPRQT